MRTADFFVGQNNLLPILQFVLFMPALPGQPRVPIDLTGATVSFQMRGLEGCCGGRVIGGSSANSGPVTILDAKGGAVSYTWQAGDTASPGTYEATWTVTVNGKSLDFPNDDYIIISIRKAVS